MTGCASLETANTPSPFSGDYLTLSEVDVKPVAITQVAPAYPPDLQRAHFGGTVMISILVDERGRVIGAEIDGKENQSADAEFGAAALAAVRQWRFKPGLKDGVPVKVAVTIPIVFGGS